MSVTRVFSTFVLALSVLSFAARVQAADSPLTELDPEIAKRFGEMIHKKFAEAMGEEGMKKFDALYAECCEAAQQQLFAFSPSQSYVQDEWIKANPDFWKPRPAVTAKAIPAR